MGVREKVRRGLVLAWIFVAVMHLMSTPWTAAAEETNLLENPGFEECGESELYPWDKEWPGFKGWFVAMSKDLNPKLGVVEDTVVEGSKYSFKISKDSSRWLYMYSTPRFDVDEFDGPYRVSAYIKTREEEKHPLGSAVNFVVWSWKTGGGNARNFPVARIEGTTEWAEYSGVVTYDDMRFTDEVGFWGVAVSTSRYHGDVWIDDVRLVRIKPDPLQISLDSAEYFLSQREAVVSVVVSEESVETGREALKVSIIDSEGRKVKSAEENIIGAEFILSLDISGLEEGSYVVKAETKDRDGEIVSVEERINRVRGPFD